MTSPYKGYGGALFAAFASICPLLLNACGGAGAPTPQPIRLVDLYAGATVEGTDIATDRAIARTEWKFDERRPGPIPAPGNPRTDTAAGKPADRGGRGDAAPRAPANKAAATTLGWQAGPGVADLAVRDGRLAGRTTDDFPLLSVERTSDVDGRDLVHAVEVRLRTSAGANLGVSYVDDDRVDFDKVIDGAKVFPWSTTVPIIAGEELRTYTLTPSRPVTASRIRHLVLRPTDAAGASFEIAWVRVVFRREHLASIPSGIGWHGLSEIYRETLVSRSPETIRLEVALPDRPWLDLGIGTIENSPVTFRVAVSRGGADETPLLERTVTTANRWEETPIDLSPWAGRTVTLSLSLGAEEGGTLGFWGSPSVRDLGAAPPVAARRAAPPQGVILIWADTLRRDHLDIYGYGRTTAPAVARMAREGALFTDSHVNGTWTKVSTTSLFTSLYPPTHGVREFSDRLPAGATTLAEVYRDAGYATLSLSSIMFTGKFTNLHQGFEQVHESGSVPDELDSKTARAFVDRLLPWLDAHREVPFFVFLHVSDPHDPFLPYAPYDTMWGDPAWKEEHQANQEKARDAIDDPLMKAFGMPNRAELDKAGIDPGTYIGREQAWYDGSIRGMDAEIARLLERLRHLGLAGRTLVVFTADHGEEFLEHGRMFHGQTAYGELANAPLVMWGPGGHVPPGVTVAGTTQAIDIMPTLLELSGLPAPDGVQGRSLVPLLRDAAANGAVARAAAGASLAHAAFAAGDAAGDGGASVPAFIQKARTSQAAGPPPRDAEMFAVVHDGWKLVQHTHRAGAPDDAAPLADDYELFATGTDPLNLKDLAPQHPDIVQRLARLLAGWRADAAAVRLTPDSEAQESLSHDELERLRSLGYIN
jgi:arylsulfatase A-like enzyme